MNVLTKATIIQSMRFWKNTGNGCALDMIHFLTAGSHLKNGLECKIKNALEQSHKVHMLRI